MKVAAYQFPLGSCHIADALSLIRAQIAVCESLGVAVLCCPEAVLGGLADYVPDPSAIALSSDRPGLADLLAPLASDTVTTIVGFTERGRDGRLYNSAAVVERGSITGVYRKRHPAINRSVYAAGGDAPVFSIGDFTFGILICRDSTFPELARDMVLRGASAIFIPSNNGMPRSRGGQKLVAAARESDIATAVANGVSVIRADVAGEVSDLVSYGSSGIIGRDGAVLASAMPLTGELIVANIEVSPVISNAQVERGVL